MGALALLWTPFTLTPSTEPIDSCLHYYCQLLPKLAWSLLPFPLLFYGPMVFSIPATTMLLHALDSCADT